MTSATDAALTTALTAYVETTDRRDVEGFVHLLAEEYLLVLPGGTVFAGRAEGRTFIERFFARTDFTQTFAERYRAVHGDTAVTVFDSVFTDDDGPVSLVIGLAWAYRDGRWQVTLDQNTLVD